MVLFGLSAGARSDQTASVAKGFSNFLDRIMMKAVNSIWFGSTAFDDDSAH
jgi:preprotein translocase subunit SecG